MRRCTYHPSSVRKEAQPPKHCAASWSKPLRQRRHRNAQQPRAASFGPTRTGNPEIDQAARSAGSLGNRPLIVLTAGDYWKPSDPIAAQQLAAFHETWVHQWQAELATLSTDGKQIVVENSDHGIPAEAPEAVVTAIRELVLKLHSQRDK